MKKRFTLGFVVAIGAVVVIFLGVTSKAYPVAMVNDEFVSARLFQIASTATLRYYEQLEKIYGVAEPVDAELFQSQMRQIALQALIEDSLVTEKLKTMFEAELLDQAIAARVNEVLSSSSQTTAIAVSELYGIALDEFGEVVLAPQARLELLHDELEKKGDNAQQWLLQALQEARVSIQVSDLAWVAGRVELTGEQPYTAKVKEVFEQLASTTQEVLQGAAASSSAASSMQE